MSAGSINAVRLMQSAPNYASGVDAIEHLWSNLVPDEIFESDFKAVVKNLVRLLRLLAAPGAAPRASPSSTPSSTPRPLHDYLRKQRGHGPGAAAPAHPAGP